MRNCLNWIYFAGALLAAYGTARAATPQRAN